SASKIPLRKASASMGCVLHAPQNTFTHIFMLPGSCPDPPETFLSVSANQHLLNTESV
ncbi:11100_t:CDS:1, partial [Gigaspora rosea]